MNNTHTPFKNRILVNKLNVIKKGYIMSAFLFVASLIIPLTVLAQPFAYVAISNDNNVAVIDTDTQSITQVTSVGPAGISPRGVAITPDRNFVYITNFQSNNVSIIDTSTNSLLPTTINVGNSPGEIAITSDGQRAHVVNVNSGIVHMINTATNTLAGGYGVGSQPLDIVLTPDNNFAFVSLPASHQVQVLQIDYNAGSGSVIKTISLGNTPAYMNITPDGKFVYVANHFSDDISVIDTDLNVLAEVARIDVSAAGCQLPYSVGITPDGTSAYIPCNNSQNMVILDLATNTITAPPINTGGLPHQIAFTSDGDFAYVVNNNFNSSVFVIDTNTNTVTKTIPVGLNAQGIAIMSDAISDVTFETLTEAVTEANIGSEENALLNQLNQASELIDSEPLLLASETTSATSNVDENSKELIRACKKLDVFIKIVASFEEGGKITAQDASNLRELALKLKEKVEC